MDRARSPRRSARLRCVCRRDGRYGRHGRWIREHDCRRSSAGARMHPDQRDAPIDHQRCWRARPGDLLVPQTASGGALVAEAARVRDDAALDGGDPAAAQLRRPAGQIDGPQRGVAVSAHVEVTRDHPVRARLDRRQLGPVGPVGAEAHQRRGGGQHLLVRRRIHQGVGVARVEQATSRHRRHAHAHPGVSEGPSSEDVAQRVLQSHDPIAIAIARCGGRDLVAPGAARSGSRPHGGDGALVLAALVRDLPSAGAFGPRLRAGSRGGRAGRRAPRAHGSHQPGGSPEPGSHTGSRAGGTARTGTSVPRGAGADVVAHRGAAGLDAGLAAQRNPRSWSR
jgi:hypothetical protein